MNVGARHALERRGFFKKTGIKQANSCKRNSFEFANGSGGEMTALVSKILVSVTFLFAILGLEMAAPILWAPRISVFFLQENLHVLKNPRFFWGGGI